MDFIFNQIPHQLDLFDYDTFLASSCEFKVGVTDALTGQPVYFDKTHLNYDSTIIKASSSIPVFSPIVPYQEGEYLDGGTSDSIPVKQALKDGCDHVIVVLTRDRSFIKEPESFRFIYSRALKKYPNMIKTLDNRHLMYNETLEFIKQLEQEGKGGKKGKEMGKIISACLCSAFPITWNDPRPLVQLVNTFMRCQLKHHF